MVSIIKNMLIMISSKPNSKLIPILVLKHNLLESKSDKNTPFYSLL